MSANHTGIVQAEPLSGLEAADLIVLPTQPSLVDLEAQEAAAARIEKLGLTDKMMFVLNRTSAAADTKKAIDYLKIRTRHPILTVVDRADYKRALEAGKAAWEVTKNKDIKAEIKKVWDLIQSIMSEGTAKTKGASKSDDQRVH